MVRILRQNSSTRRRGDRRRAVSGFVPAALAMTLLVLDALAAPDVLAQGTTLISPMSDEEAKVFPFTPPFGDAEATMLSRQVREQLAIALTESPPDEMRMRQCRRALDEIILFVREEDERLVTFDSYEWYKLGSHTIAGGEPRRVEFGLDRPLERVNAIAFRAEGGRVIAEGITVLDARDGRAHLPQTELYLRKDVPKREAIYLYEPRGLQSLEVTLTTDQPAPATVYAYAGVSQGSEHGKRALFMFRQARRELDEYRLRDATEHLKQAEFELQQFARSHAPEPLR